MPVPRSGEIGPKRAVGVRSVRRAADTSGARDGREKPVAHAAASRTNPARNRSASTTLTPRRQSALPSGSV